MSALSEDLPIFREMRAEDLDSILQIEKDCHNFPWSEGIFRDCLRVGYYCPVLEIKGDVCAYGVMSVAAGEAHIFNICVLPVLRRQGYGEMILRHLIDVALVRKSRTVFLEVRPSNVVAISLYEKLGFIEVGVRKNYYPDKAGREDALIMAIEIGTEE